MVLLGWITLPYLFPFALALVAASLLEPLVRGLVARGLSRSMAAFCALAGSVLAMLGLTAVFLARLAQELVVLSQKLPALLAHLRAAYEHWPQQLGPWGRYIPQWPGLTRPGPWSQFVHGVSSVLQVLLGAMARLPEVLLVAIVILVATYFFIRDRQLLSDLMWTHLSAAWQARWHHMQKEFRTSALGLIKAELTLVGLTAVITALGLVALGSPYALVLGLAAGCLDLVPFLGPTVLLGPWLIWALVHGQLPLALKLGALLLILGVERQTIEARIVGRQIGLHPLWTLLALYLGFRVFGPWGIILGPLCAATLRAVWAALRLLPEGPL